MSINEKAPVVTHDRITIDAPIARIWQLQTDVASWPTWQADVPSAVIDGKLGVGATFRWQTSGLDITSTVTAFDAPTHVEWAGPPTGSTPSTPGGSTPHPTESRCGPRSHGRATPSMSRSSRCSKHSTPRSPNGCVASSQGHRPDQGRRDGHRRRRPRGEGDGQVRETVRALAADGFDGFFSMEPHPSTYTAYGALSGPKNFTRTTHAFTTMLDSEGIAYR